MTNEERIDRLETELAAMKRELGQKDKQIAELRDDISSFAHFRMKIENLIEGIFNLLTKYQSGYEKALDLTARVHKLLEVEVKPDGRVN